MAIVKVLARESHLTDMSSKSDANEEPEQESDCLPQRTQKRSANCARIFRNRGHRRSWLGATADLLTTFTFFYAFFAAKQLLLFRISERALCHGKAKSWRISPKRSPRSEIGEFGSTQQVGLTTSHLLLCVPYVASDLGLRGTGGRTADESIRRREGECGVGCDHT